MKSSTTYIASKYRMDYFFKKGEENAPLVIFLHGYGQSAQNFYSDIKDIIDDTHSVLIPNGPFPLPGKARTVESLGFAWYFYDSQSDEYYIPYEIPAQMIQSLIEELNVSTLPKIIVGYSQGGYLAPFVAEVLTNIKNVICINSSFRDDFMKKTNEDFLVHAINGANDDLVDPKLARERHEKLSRLNRQGDFNLIADTNHRINDAIKSKLKSYLR